MCLAMFCYSTILYVLHKTCERSLDAGVLHYSSVFGREVEDHSGKPPMPKVPFVSELEAGTYIYPYYRPSHQILIIRAQLCRQIPFFQPHAGRGWHAPGQGPQPRRAIIPTSWQCQARECKVRLSSHVACRWRKGRQCLGQWLGWSRQPSTSWWCLVFLSQFYVCAHDLLLPNSVFPLLPVNVLFDTMHVESVADNKVRRPRAIRKSNTGQNTGQRATSDTMLTSQMFSPWCHCHRIGSALLTFWRKGAEPL